MESDDDTGWSDSPYLLALEITTFQLTILQFRRQCELELEALDARYFSPRQFLAMPNSATGTHPFDAAVGECA